MALNFKDSSLTQKLITDDLSNWQILVDNKAVLDHTVSSGKVDLTHVLKYITGYVKTTTNENIAGVKTFTNYIRAGASVIEMYDNANDAYGSVEFGENLVLLNSSTSPDYFFIADGNGHIVIRQLGTPKHGTISVDNLTATRQYYLPDASGTIALVSDVATKQNTLVSGTNIKTLSSISLLGSGDIAVKTINGNSIFGTGNITISGGGTYTSNNGIVESSNNFKLGGNLVENTLVTTNNFNLTLRGNGGTASVDLLLTPNAASLSTSQFGVINGFYVTAGSSPEIRVSGTKQFEVTSPFSKFFNNLNIGASDLTVFGSNGSVKFTGAGTPGTNKVLTSDAAGNATWQTLVTGTNIYNADGLVTGDRNIDVDTRNIRFSNAYGFQAGSFADTTIGGYEIKGNHLGSLSLYNSTPTQASRILLDPAFISLSTTTLPATERAEIIINQNVIIEGNVAASSSFISNLPSFFKEGLQVHHSNNLTDGLNITNIIQTDEDGIYSIANDSVLVGYNFPASLFSYSNRAYLYNASDEEHTFKTGSSGVYISGTVQANYSGLYTILGDTHLATYNNVAQTFQYSDDNYTYNALTDVHKFDGGIKLNPSLSAGLDKVLTSDVAGNATWKELNTIQGQKIAFQTTNATPTLAHTVILPDNCNVLLEIVVTARSTGNNRITGRKQFIGAVVASDLTIDSIDNIGAITKTGTLSTSDFNFIEITASSNDIGIELTGIAATTINWDITITKTIIDLF